MTGEAPSATAAGRPPAEETDIDPVVLVRRDAGVVVVELNRPSRKNGLTGELVEALIDEVHAVAQNPADRVLVLTGAGDAFCSGMDLGAPVKPDELTFMRRVAALCTAIYNLPKPTIAKVNGPAVGFGANFALCCDLVLASENAVFAEVFTERGLSVDGGGSWLLPRLVGMAKAKEILFFGQRIEAAEAQRLGLVNRTVPLSELDGLCRDWAVRLADGPPRAISTIKGLLNNAASSTFVQAIEAEAVAQSLSFRSKEVREGMAAFAERRRPNFR
ncbi:enoyl-CoA hydratase-related protein [Arthrobacter sp. I2-34]|uniref:Enoyl-CoA hydratase-related protein n=1 Tax=Arthrobacter hankyongi TaxID=2904801 RepID=A0ABS9L3K4_9MICC|nr:enoyl-CoA hydratase-related protein [Arthrobacter hankyongi]MCG2621235.1 enoyl-CoA hydratase-related protein [Arthrobacter hankyongi]